MGILRKAGLVAAEKHGLWMWYRRNEESIKGLCKALNTNI